MPKVFISHASADRSFVEKEIVPLLQRYGIGTWYAREDIISAGQWERSIAAGLRECDWFLVVLSPRSIASKWVTAEVNWALDERGESFVPLLMEDCDWKNLHLMIRNIQHVDFRTPTYEARERLLQIWNVQQRQAFILTGQWNPVTLAGPVLAVGEYDGDQCFYALSQSQVASIGPSQHFSEAFEIPRLLEPLMQEPAANASATVASAACDGGKIALLLKSGDLVVGYLDFIASRDRGGFQYHSTGLPPNPLRASYRRAGEVVAGYQDGALWCWKKADDGPRCLRKSGASIVQVANSLMSSVISGAGDGSITIWSSDDHQIKKEFVTGDDAIVDLAVAKYERAVITAAATGAIKVWNYEGDLIHALADSSDQIVCLCCCSFSAPPGSPRYLAVGRVGGIEVWDWGIGKRLWRVNGWGSAPTAIGIALLHPLTSYGPSSETMVVVGYEDGRVSAWGFGGTLVP